MPSCLFSGRRDAASRISMMNPACGKPLCGPLFAFLTAASCQPAGSRHKERNVVLRNLPDSSIRFPIARSKICTSHCSLLIPPPPCESTRDTLAARTQRLHSSQLTRPVEIAPLHVVPLAPAIFAGIARRNKKWSNWSQESILVTGGTGSFREKFVEVMLRDYHPHKTGDFQPR